nr:MAG: capsid protein [Chemarfal virus 233]
MARTQAKQKKKSTTTGKVARAAGATVGYITGGIPGAVAGFRAGAAISKWTGNGDYTVSQNTIMKSALRASTGIPMMHKANQSVIVRHREFIRTVTSSTAYAVQAVLPLNPGIALTFPWLAALATNYQEYSIKGMVFHYVPTSGMVTGANTALGTVMLQTAYRATDADPVSKYELLNEYWAAECAPCDHMAHPIECKSSETVLGARYVRDGPVTDDLMFYDYGKTIVATQGQQTNGQAIGDLWVTYEVELRKPRLHASLGRSADSFQSYLDTGDITRFFLNATTVFNSFPSLVAARSPAAGFNDIKISPGSPGAFLLTIQFRGTSFTAGAGTLSLQNCTQIPFGFDNTLTTFLLVVGSTRATLTIGFKITDPTLDTFLTFSGTIVSSVFSAIITAQLTQIDADQATVC